MTDVARLAKLEEDMYFGRGPQNPSVTTRLTRSEDRHDASDVRQDKFEKDISTVKTNSWAILVLLVGTLLAVIFKGH